MPLSWSEIRARATRATRQRAKPERWMALRHDCFQFVEVFAAHADMWGKDDGYVFGVEGCNVVR